MATRAPRATKEKTPEQIAQDAQADAQARAAGAADVEEVLSPEPEEGSETILIHFVEDGFTALGRTWYRGQELEFEIGSEAYEDTQDRNGSTWLDLASDDYAQIDVYDKVFFRLGPWKGKGWDEPNAENEERKRNRKPPVLSSER